MAVRYRKTRWWAQAVESLVLAGALVDSPRNETPQCTGWGRRSWVNRVRRDIQPAGG